MQYTIVRLLNRSDPWHIRAVEPTPTGKCGDEAKGESAVKWNKVACLCAVLAALSGRTVGQEHDRDRVIVGQEELNAPSVWVLDNLTFENGTSIRTNGFSLNITVTRNLTVRGEASIYAFPPTADLPAAPSKPPPAAAGRSYNPGPNTDGSGAPGPPGGPGAPGRNGDPGVSGKTPGPIVLVVIGNFRGTLRIRNGGSNGGRGGDGGDGGNGGTGGQGQRAESNRILGGIVAGCASGPGFGGSGGAGGQAGNGGPGGPAGNGGPITVIVKGDTTGGRIIAASPPGSPGSGGNPGRPGQGGMPGFGGRGAAGCQGRETERRGPPGSDGGIGAEGQIGQEGHESYVQIDPPSLRETR